VVFVVERRTRNFYPRNSTGVWFSIPRLRKFYYELAKTSLLTKILPHEKYPLYGMIIETVQFEEGDLQPESTYTKPIEYFKWISTVMVTSSDHDSRFCMYIAMICVYIMFAVSKVKGR